MKKTVILRNASPPPQHPQYNPKRTHSEIKKKKNAPTQEIPTVKNATPHPRILVLKGTQIPENKDWER
jgi:hypothetical protein